MSTQEKKVMRVSGKDAEGNRLTSKIFEEEVRGAAAAADELVLESFGQHNIGLRLGFRQAGLDYTNPGAGWPAAWLYGAAGRNHHL